MPAEAASRIMAKSIPKVEQAGSEKAVVGAPEGLGVRMQGNSLVACVIRTPWRILFPK